MFGGANEGVDGLEHEGQAADSIAGTFTRSGACPEPPLRRPERSERGFRSRRNGLENLTDEQTPQGEISYGYDAASRRSTMQVVGQTAVSYTWDNANRLTGITQSSQSVGLSYDAANRRTQLTLPNGVTVAYTYDADSRISGLTYTAGRGAAIWARSPTLEPALSEAEGTPTGGGRRWGGAWRR